MVKTVRLLLLLSLLFIVSSSALSLSASIFYEPVSINMEYIDYKKIWINARLVETDKHATIIFKIRDYITGQLQYYNTIVLGGGIFEFNDTAVVNTNYSVVEVTISTDIDTVSYHVFLFYSGSVNASFNEVETVNITGNGSDIAGSLLSKIFGGNVYELLFSMIVVGIFTGLVLRNDERAILIGFLLYTIIALFVIPILIPENEVEIINRVRLSAGLSGGIAFTIFLIKYISGEL